MRLIWATRGRTWGFRFLDRGGFADPLATYDEAFAGLEGERTICRRQSEKLVVRFPDPEGRTDSAGRAISHDFVLLAPPEDVDRIDSVNAAVREIWPVVAARYEQVWRQTDAPNDPD